MAILPQKQTIFAGIIPKSPSKRQQQLPMAAQDEVTDFLLGMPEKTGNPLDWWAQEQNVAWYPRLCHMACDFLTIPGLYWILQHCSRLIFIPSNHSQCRKGVQLGTTCDAIHQELFEQPLNVFCHVCWELEQVGLDFSGLPATRLSNDRSCTLWWWWFRAWGYSRMSIWATTHPANLLLSGTGSRYVKLDVF